MYTDNSIKENYRQYLKYAVHPMSFAEYVKSCEEEMQSILNELYSEDDRAYRKIMEEF